MADEIVLENVDAEPLTVDDGSHGGYTNSEIEAEETDAWQATDNQEALAEVTAAAAVVEASAELEQLQQEEAQTNILATIPAMLESRLNQLQESLTVATEAQTREIAALSNTLSDFLTSLNPATTSRPRRNPAQRAEERRKRSTEKKAARRKV